MKRGGAFSRSSASEASSTHSDMCLWSSGAPRRGLGRLRGATTALCRPEVRHMSDSRLNHAASRPGPLESRRGRPEKGAPLFRKELVVTKRRRKTVCFYVTSKSTKGRPPFRIGSQGTPQRSVDTSRPREFERRRSLGGAGMSDIFSHVARLPSNSCRLLVGKRATCGCVGCDPVQTPHSNRGAPRSNLGHLVDNVYLDRGVILSVGSTR